MIKRMLIYLTLVAFLFPVFGSLYGHDFLHAIHAVHEAQHFNKSHKHHPHDHSIPDGNAEHPPIDTCLISFISDHFHGELQVSPLKGVRLIKTPLYPNTGNRIPFYEDDPKFILSVFHEQPVALQRNDLYLKTKRMRIGI